MSGVRLHNPRQGDRSEYLAVYMLSALGLVTQVPRQEDIGIDLICNLAEQESGIVGFRHHFAVSVKSASTPRAVFVPADSKKDDPKYTDHFNWLFHLELPLMLAVIDKEKQELALYSTLPAWFLFHERLGDCGVIELVPRTQVNGSNPGVDRLTRGFMIGGEVMVPAERRDRRAIGHDVAGMSLVDKLSISGDEIGCDSSLAVPADVVDALE